jgi:hypothetical protein
VLRAFFDWAVSSGKVLGFFFQSPPRANARGALFFLAACEFWDTCQSLSGFFFPEFSRFLKLSIFKIIFPRPGLIFRGGQTLSLCRRLFFRTFRSLATNGIRSVFPFKHGHHRYEIFFFFLGIREI